MNVYDIKRFSLLESIVCISEQLFFFYCTNLLGIIMYQLNGFFGKSFAKNFVTVDRVMEVIHDVLPLFILSFVQVVGIDPGTARISF